jgi:LAS superfamily LD-carboxypeptidase LdcB
MEIGWESNPRIAEGEVTRRPEREALHPYGTDSHRLGVVAEIGWESNPRIAEGEVTRRPEREALHPYGTDSHRLGVVAEIGWESNPPSAPESLDNSRDEVSRNGPIRHSLDLKVQTGDSQEPSSSSPADEPKSRRPKT